MTGSQHLHNCSSCGLLLKWSVSSQSWSRDSVEPATGWQACEERRLALLVRLLQHQVTPWVWSPGKHLTRWSQCDGLGQVLLGNVESRFILSWKLCSQTAVASLFVLPISLRCWLGLQHPQISIQMICGMCSQLRGLRGPAANILVPETTAHLQGSRGVHAEMGWGC